MMKVIIGALTFFRSERNNIFFYRGYFHLLHAFLSSFIRIYFFSYFCSCYKLSMFLTRPFYAIYFGLLNTCSDTFIFFSFFFFIFFLILLLHFLLITRIFPNVCVCVYVNACFIVNKSSQ